MTRNVLVIDDSATVRKLVEISLRGRSLRPHFADNGGDGIRRATALTPAVILLDFMLPDMTGVDVCRALAADPRTHAIPILVVTAKDARARGEFQPFPAVVDFITKPFTAPDLIARIDQAIAGEPITGHTPLPAVSRGALRTAELPRLPAERTAELPRAPAERAAKLLFGRLRDGLALLPSQLRELEPGSIAPQLARRLLTPQVVEGILADLRPICAELEASALADESSASEPLAPDAVVDRAPGFSAKVQAAQLSSLDRRILALTDGRTPLAEIARRLVVASSSVAARVRRLVARGLVHLVPVGPRPRPVVICEPDVAEFHAPLRSLLAQRATARELIAVGRIDEVVEATRQHQACLVLVNATARIPEVCAVAHALRADLAFPDLAMIAVLEARVDRTPELLAAGFDAILGKPMMVNELERFLTPADTH